MGFVCIFFPLKTEKWIIFGFFSGGYFMTFPRTILFCPAEKSDVLVLLQVKMLPRVFGIPRWGLVGWANGWMVYFLVSPTKIKKEGTYLFNIFIYLLIHFYIYMDERWLVDWNQDFVFWLLLRWLVSCGKKHFEPPPFNQLFCISRKTPPPILELPSKAICQSPGQQFPPTKRNATSKQHYSLGNDHISHFGKFGKSSSNITWWRDVSYFPGG